MRRLAYTPGDHTEVTGESGAPVARRGASGLAREALMPKREKAAPIPELVEVWLSDPDHKRRWRWRVAPGWAPSPAPSWSPAASVA